MTRNSKQFYDFDSVSEYDDSVVQGDVMNKEELFQRYQRAQALAKRYKTRSLEVTECYKQLELENMKLTQTLTDSQDCSIRRLSELREQIELDKKAKTDIEENYQLIIDEKGELINVLRLQISLFKEGKDLPAELECQIKERHDLEIQRQKQKDDEIKELKSSMLQRENLLQRCKEKITSLNTQLTEMKVKNENITNTSIEGDSDGERFSNELAKLSCQHALSLENIQKEHSERIRNMLCECDEQKSALENQLHSDYEKQLLAVREELKELNDRFSFVSQDNERLQEQVNINANIIENLLSLQDQQSNHVTKPSTVIDSSSFFELQSSQFNQEVNMVTHEDKVVIDLNDEIKFLLGKIEQLEELKMRTEDETTKTEEDLRNMELTLMKERDDCEIKCNAYKTAVEETKMELISLTSKCENLSYDVSNLNVIIAKKKEELEDVVLSRRECEERIVGLEKELRHVTEEKSSLILQLDSLDKENAELESQLQVIRKDHDTDKSKFLDQCIAVKSLQDKCDELNSIIEKETHEKDKLLALLNGNDRITESPFNENDGLMLKIVEMRQVYDQQVEEGKEQVYNMDIILTERNVQIQELETNIGERNVQIHELETKIEERNVQIHELETKIGERNDQKDVVLGQLKEMETSKEEIQNRYNTVLKEFEDYRSNVESIDNEKEQLLNCKNDEIKDKEKTILMLREENERLGVLESKMKDMTTGLESKVETINSIDSENGKLKAEIEQLKLQCLECTGSKENVEKECLSKDEQLRKMTEEVEMAGNRFTELQSIKEGLSNEISELQIRLEELTTENDNFKSKVATLEDQQVESDKLVEEFLLCKKEVTIVQGKYNEMNERYTSLQIVKDEADVNNLSAINVLKDSLRTTEEEVTKSKESIELLEVKINAYKKYLNIFRSWADGLISNSGNDLTRPEFWSMDLENDCNGDDDLVMTGRSLQGVDKAWFNCQHQLCTLKEDICSVKVVKNDNFLEAVRGLCASNDDDGKLLTEEDILQRLASSRSVMERRDRRLIDLKLMLTSDELIELEKCEDDSSLVELRSFVVERIRDLKSRIVEQSNAIKVLESDKEGLLKKFEKMTNEKVQHFRFLTKTFELSGIDFEDKSFIKIIMKGLKDFAKKSAIMSEELIRLKDVDQQLKDLSEECQLKDVKLEELRETISDDSSKLFALRQELDKSLSRLNDFADEKGRIDEEKQSLRKELKELNEKIQDLKQDCEKQLNDKMILEKHFDDSLEKVKLNHHALEDNYRKEIEKHLGYQHYLEEQISTTRDETSRKMTENIQTTNIKLEEVLKQSEELLVLNHQYKDLLERSKHETTDALERLKQSELNVKEVENEIRVLRGRDEELVKSSVDVAAAHEQVIRERDNLVIQLQSLINEKEKSLETLVHLQSSSKDVESEKEKYLVENKDLTERYRVKEEELVICRELLEKGKRDHEEMKRENDKLVKQLENEHANYTAIKNDFDDKQLEIKALRDKIDVRKSKLKKQKADHEREIFEIKQQYNDEKSNLNDDHNGKIKKLAKEFNEKMLTKEQDFQKTFHDALENVRREEARQKSDLKDEIESLNRMLIDFEMEKNSRLDTISECEEEIKKYKSLLQTKECQCQSLLDDISGYKTSIVELEYQVSKMKSMEEAIEQRSKMNQTIDTTSCFEDISVETVNANDHDILQMHCADLEEQLRQLHQDNISLRQAVLGKSHTPPATHEQIVSAVRSHPLTNQPSLDNGSVRNTAGSFRSPNTSCSEYQFCPYPITEATEYEYLRDILVKYMTGLETNTLSRVLCTVMKFNRDETDRIVRFEQDKRKLLQIQLFS